MKDCPSCGLTNPDSAQRCDCGFDFSSRTIKESYLSDAEQSDLERQRVDVPTAAIKVIVFALAAAPILFLGSFVTEAYQRSITVTFAVIVGWVASHYFGSLARKFLLKKRSTD